MLFLSIWSSENIREAVWKLEENLTPSKLPVHLTVFWPFHVGLLVHWRCSALFSLSGGSNSLLSWACGWIGGMGEGR